MCYRPTLVRHNSPWVGGPLFPPILPHPSHLSLLCSPDHAFLPLSVRIRSVKNKHLSQYHLQAFFLTSLDSKKISCDRGLRKTWTIKSPLLANFILKGLIGLGKTEPKGLHVRLSIVMVGQHMESISRKSHAVSKLSTADKGSISLKIKP